MFNFLTKLMSCGSCGTNAPHGGEDKKCVACECPCDAHKEHTCEKCKDCGKEKCSCS